MECKEIMPKPLPYAYDALEPLINSETLKVHHDTLYVKYVNNLNAALKKYPQYCNLSLQDLILNSSSMPEDISLQVFNNAGGVYNHQMYFDMMNPQGKQYPENWLLDGILRTFGTIKSFEDEFKSSAMSVFGSGWTWLAVNSIGGLEILNTPNQNTPFSLNLTPLIPLDIWEHAYFLQYKAGRSDYIDAWLKLADWKRAERLYISNIQAR